MYRINFEYKISIVKSTKKNDVLLLDIHFNNEIKKLYGSQAKSFVKANKFLFGDSIRNYVKAVKDMTDKAYELNNK